MRFPNAQGVWARHGVAELVSQDRELREMGVGRDEVTSVVALGNGVSDGVIVSISVLIEDVSMPVAKGTSFDILSRNSDFVTVLDQTSESQSLSSSPIDVLSALDALDSLLENLNNLSVEIFILGQCANPLAEVSDPLDGDA